MSSCTACGCSNAEFASLCEYCGAKLPRKPFNNEELVSRIKQLMESGKKNEAIKALREATGAELAEAKTAVESIERNDLNGVNFPIRLSGNKRLSIEPDFERQLVTLLTEGRKIEAIQLIRSRSACSLKEGKEFVEDLARKHNIETRSAGCLGVVLLALMLIATGTVCTARVFGNEGPSQRHSTCGDDSNASPISTARISDGTKTTDGWISHEVISDLQARPIEIRVLLPDDHDVMKPYPILFVLPVEASRESKYGDGLAEIKRLDLHNKHNVVCVAPTFAHLPWYADHPTDKSIQQESYLLKVVVPFIDQTYLSKPIAKRSSAERKEHRWLLGFSKSGWGAWSLLVRHPDVFGRAAAWDAPLNMQRFDLYGAGQVFGTQEHFDKHRVLPAIVDQPALKKDPTKTSSARLILTGYDNFREHHEAAHMVLEESHIPHIYRDGPKLKHNWHSGWVEEAITLLSNPEQSTNQSEKR